MKKIFFENLGLKLLALAFALALWFLVVGEKVSEVGLLVPLGFKGISEEMIMVSSPPGDIDVRVVGPKSFINKLSPAQISVDVDLSDAKDGLNTIRLTPEEVKVPRGIEVVRIRPASVEIRMERLVTSVVPVEVKLVGVPAEGYEVAAFSVEPGSVAIVGRGKKVRKIKSIKTEPVDVGGLTGTETVEVDLDTVELGIAGVEPDVVDVTVEIKETEKPEEEKKPVEEEKKK
ncbi:MAG: CdaR family protein [Thermodesulfobacteriota bacterium]